MSTNYSDMERRVDGTIHVLSLVLACAVAILLPPLAFAEGGTRAGVATTVYSLGLLAVFSTSAAYNLLRSPDRREALRRFDHGAIYLAIAGTYTPFAMVGLGGTTGDVLLGLVWTVALAGVALKLRRPRQFERVGLVLYLVLGWIALPLVGLIVDSLPPSAFALLVLGGLLYTVGVGFHLWRGLAYQNAIWHGFVLLAAACHAGAIAETLVA